MKKLEFLPQTPSTKAENDSERRNINKVFTFSQFASDLNGNYKEEYSNNKINELITTDDETKEKLENIRNNIFNIRQKVSSYSKIYDNISTQIGNGMINNLNKDDKIKNKNYNFQQQNNDYENENQRLKNRILELENQIKNINKNHIIKLKKNCINEMKELQKIFDETIDSKNREIEKLNHNQEILIQQIEQMKYNFNKEKNELRKYNEELLNKNYELQKQLNNIYYNNPIFSNNNVNVIKNMYKKNRRQKSDDLNLTTVIEEDKSISFSFNNTNNSINNNIVNNDKKYKSQNNRIYNSKVELRKSLSSFNIKSNNDNFQNEANNIFIISKK